MSRIKNSDELEFAVFCIENVASALGKDAENVYAMLTKDSDLLHSYIVPNYEILHTQGKDYIVEDIIAVMKEAGLKI